MEAKNEADGTFGYTLDDLLKIEAPPPPEDFAAFWEETYRLATARVPEYKIEKEIWSPDAGVKILQVRFKTYDGFEIGMWIARPESSNGGLVIGQGYGNLATPPTSRNPGLTVALPSIRGLGISQCAQIPWKPAAHAGYGIQSRETYVIRGAVTDIWEATSVLTDLFPDTASNLNYSGGSLGGVVCDHWPLESVHLAWREAVEGADGAFGRLDGIGEFHSGQREDRGVFGELQLVAVAA